MDWSRGGIRWMMAGAVSVVLHVVVLTAMMWGETGEQKAEQEDAAAKGEIAQTEDNRPVAEEKSDAGKPEETIEKVKEEVATKGSEDRKTADIIKGIRSGDQSGSIGQIASKFEDTAKEVAHSRPVSETPAKAKGKPNAKPTAGGSKFYVVKSGDTLTKIVREYGMAAPELAKLNGTTVNKLSKLRIGQKIRIAR